jgi:glycosyltransferase involved in cell wall biosynthesis
MKIKPHPAVKVAFFHIMAEGPSGAANNIFRLFHHIDSKILETILVGQIENELTARVKELGIQVFIIPFPPGLDVYDKKLLNLNVLEFFRTLGAVWKYQLLLVKFFRRTTPDIIWADNIRTFFSVYAASKFTGCKVIWNIWSEPKGKVAWLFHRWGLLIADVINLEYTTQGQKLFGDLANYRFFNRKLIPLYTGVSDFELTSGISIRDELNLSSTDILIMIASIVTPLKGQIDLIKAMDLLVRTNSNIHLLVVGVPLESHSDSIAYDSRLKQYTKEKKLSNNVHFLGWRTDMRDLLQDVDIYVSGSYSESFPVAVREAMLFEKPVVVTNVGGTFELVKVGVSGFLFTPGDIESFVQHIKQLIQNPKLRASMGKEGKLIIEKSFSTKVYINNFENMVLSICQ